MAILARITRQYPVVTLTIGIGLAVAGLSLAGQPSAGRWVATVYVVAFIAWTSWGMLRDILRGHFGLDILAVVAMIATLAVDEYVASLIVVLMLSGGEALEDIAAQRARRDLSALLEHSPQRAHLVVDEGSGDSGVIRDVAVDEVEVGDTVLVRPSEIIPVDGELLSDEGAFDESSITGESLPVTRAKGEEVMSGVVNGARAVQVRALRVSADSQFQQIVALVKEAEASKAPMVRLADRFAVPFTAVSLLIGGVAWAVSGDPVRFAEVLVLATPCPLLIAAPVAFLGGISRTSKAGVVVKGGAVLERLARVRSVAFDKTGTLTQGKPRLVAVRPEPGFDEESLLACAASAEQYSSHVLAEGIRTAVLERGIELTSSDDASEIATMGVTAVLDGRTVVVGKPGYIADLVPTLVRTPLDAGQAAAYVAIDGRYAGALVVADQVRPESAGVVAWLRSTGVTRVVMLTGDATATASAVAQSVGIAEVHAELLPADKVRIATEMQPRPILMVGDGVNDAPVLAAADVGVALGAKGATAAGEAADAVVLRDSLDAVADAIHIGRYTRRVALAAIWIGITLSLGLMLIATTGVIPAVVGALTQEVVDLAAILYALRALRPPAR